MSEAQRTMGATIAIGSNDSRQIATSDPRQVKNPRAPTRKRKPRLRARPV